MRRYRPRRVPTNMPVQVYATLKDPPMKMLSSNLSLNGIFVQPASQFDVGQVVLCTFRLPNRQRPFYFFSEVARRVTTEEDPELDDGGLGLHFIDSTVLERHHIRNFVRSHEAEDNTKENDWFL